MPCSLYVLSLNYCSRFSDYKWNKFNKLQDSSFQLSLMELRWLLLPFWLWGCPGHLPQGDPALLRLRSPGTVGLISGFGMNALCVLNSFLSFNTLGPLLPWVFRGWQTVATGMFCLELSRCQSLHEPRCQWQMSVPGECPAELLEAGRRL